MTVMIWEIPAIMLLKNLVFVENADNLHIFIKVITWAMKRNQLVPWLIFNIVISTFLAYYRVVNRVRIITYQQ